MDITISTLTLWLNLLVAGLLLLGFIIGFFRGMHKSIYRFLVSIVVVAGAWLLFPTVFKALIDFNLSSLNILNINGQSFETIKEVLIYGTDMLIKVESGVDITTTNTYALIYGVVEMVFRIVFIIIILVLNWTLFRLIFGILYIFIAPRKRDKRGLKKVKSLGSRLIGGLVSTFGMLFIIFLFSIPLAGISSIATNVGTLLEMAPADSNFVNISLGDEVIDDKNLSEFKIQDLKSYGEIYRKTIPGVVFSIKLSKTETDLVFFDDLLNIKINDEEIKIRQEIETVVNSISYISNNLIVPLVENDMKMSIEILNNLDGAKFNSCFQELSNLQLIKLVIPVGIEFVSGLLKDHEFGDYVDINVVIEELKRLNINILLSEIGNLIEVLFNCINNSEYKLGNIIEGDTFEMSRIINIFINATDDDISNVFNTIANLQLITTAEKISFGYIKKTLKTTSFGIIKPKLTVSDNGYVKIDDKISNLKYTEDMDFDSFTFVINENDYWVINDIVTNVKSDDDIIEFTFEGVVLKDLITSFGEILISFKKLGLTSLTDLQKFIKGEDADIDFSGVTWDNLNDFFGNLFDLPIIENNKHNIYAFANNILPNDFRKSFVEVPIEKEDISALVMTFKIIIEAGIYQAISNKEEIDFVEVINNYSDDIIDALLTSKVISKNITPIANTIMKITLKTDVFVIPDIDWETEGKVELKGLFDILAVVLKYKDKIATDFFSLEDSEVDELFDSISVNFSRSRIISSNMNNMIKFLFGPETNSFGIIIEPFESNDEWDETEINNMITAFKIIIKLLKDQDKELFIKLLSVEENQVNDLLNSKFILKTIVANIYPQLEEGQPLNGILVVDIDKNDPSWKEELRIILTKGTKLFGGIENFSSGLDIDKVIFNISELSNNLNNKDDDEVGELLESTILVDTIVKIIKDLETQTSGMIIVDPNIQWVDKGNIPGELRIFFKIIKDLLIDDEGNVLYSKLSSGDSNEIIGLFIDAEKQTIDDALDSKILIDSIKGLVISFGEDTYNEKNELVSKSILVINQDSIPTDDDWRREVYIILTNVKTILVPDANGNYFASANVNYEGIYNLDDSKITELLQSNILRDTIVIALCDVNEIETSLAVEAIKEEHYKNNGDINDFDNLSRKDQNMIITSNEFWKDKYDTNGNIISIGEVHKILIAAKTLIEGESFNINKILGDDTDLDNIFSSRIILDTFYVNIEKLANNPDPVLFIDENMERNKEEAINFVESVKVVLGNSTDITNLDSTIFKFDEIINKTDEQIKTLLKSRIIEYSASIIVYKMITDKGALAAFIETDYNYEMQDISYLAETEKKKVLLEMVSSDLENLFKTIRDLQNLGLNYNEFSFATFNNVINAQGNPEENADEIADTLTKSLLIIHSLKKLMTSVLDNQLNDEEMELIELDLNKNPELDAERNYWLNLLDGNGDVIENGELRKLMRMLTVLNTFTTRSDFSDIEDEKEIAIPLLKVNDSIVTQKLIPKFIGLALKNAESWLYMSISDPNKNVVLTKEQWDDEINLLASIVVAIQKNGFGDLASINVKDENLDTNNLGNLLKLIAGSRYLDIANLGALIQKGVDDTFTEADCTVSEVSNYHPDHTDFSIYDDYNKKIEKWNGTDTSKGEIDKLMEIIGMIKYMSDDVLQISDKTWNPDTNEFQGVTNARKIGKFLDKCSESIMLSSIVDSIFELIVSKNPSLKFAAAILNINPDTIKEDGLLYEDILVRISEFICIT